MARRLAASRMPFSGAVSSHCFDTRNHIAVWSEAVPGTSQAGREKVEVPGGLVDSSTGGVPSSNVPDTPKLPFWEGADLTLLGLDCWRPNPCLLLLCLRALLLLACIINN